MIKSRGTAFRLMRVVHTRWAACSQEHGNDSSGLDHQSAASVNKCDAPLVLGELDNTLARLIPST